MEKEVIWTSHAKIDLQRIYEFNSIVIGEEKAFGLIEALLDKTSILYREFKGGTRYLSSLAPEINYQKLILGHYLIIFREEEKAIYINRVFDARQDPEKLKL